MHFGISQVGFVRFRHDTRTKLIPGKVDEMSALQLWLSARPKRTVTHSNDTMYGPDFSTEITFSRENGFDYTTEIHKTNHALVRGGQKGSQSGPPMHIHLTQTEYFTVVQGKLGTICEGKLKVLGKDDGELVIPPRLAHRFWAEENAEGEDLIMKVRVSEADSGGFDEQFFRNVSSYLKDCSDQSLSPSPFQMILFMYTHGMVIALPLPLQLTKALHYFFGYWIGVRILGYSASYPEYWQGSPKKTL